MNPEKRNSLKNLVTTLALTTALAAGASQSALGAESKAAQGAKPTKTVVLVHGAFADGSSWNKIIPLLQAKGLNVVAVQNPLTSLGDDVTFARRAIDAQSGPVVLVGHSWGGSVITQAGDHEKVKALVYVAAFAPSAGETSVDGIKAFPPAIGLKSPQVDKSGFLTLSGETIAAHFAQDLSPAETNLITTTQGAVRGANFEEKLTVAAWQTKPSWYIVAEQDYMIQPDAQRALAKKINAKVTSLPASHVPMLSRPRDVANVIIDAADSIK
jgi:pimeloyl-ACP methyl ester carboxylesterase